MISLVTGETVAGFLEAASLDPVIGARLFTLFHVYGLNDRTLCLWLQKNSAGAATAALARMDGWLTASVGAEADLDELAEFARVIGGFAFLEAAPPLCDKLRDMGTYDGSLTMAYRGGGFGGGQQGIDASPDLRQVYDVSCAANAWFAKTTNWPGWYTHTSHLLRHGLGFCGGIYRDSRLVSTGGVYTMGQSVAVIGGLATLPDYRGRGYAGQLLRWLIDTSIERGKLPVLFCAGDSLADYYSRCGFAPFGRWAEIDLTSPAKPVTEGAVE